MDYEQIPRLCPGTGAHHSEVRAGRGGSDFNPHAFASRRGTERGRPLLEGMRIKNSTHALHTGFLWSFRGSIGKIGVFLSAGFEPAVRR